MLNKRTLSTKDYSYVPCYMYILKQSNKHIKKHRNHTSYNKDIMRTSYSRFVTIKNKQKSKNISFTSQLNFTKCLPLVVSL